MTNQEIQAKCQEYREMKRLIEEAQAIADSIADELKAAMTETGENKLTVGEYKLSYSEFTRKDIDKKQLLAELPEVYATYLKETSYKRFIVS